MNGKDLRLAVRNSGKKIAVLAKETGIEERTIFNLYKKESVEQHYLDKIEAAGVKLKKTETQPTAELTTQVMGLVSQTIEMLRTEMIQINKNNDQILEANKALTKLLNKAMDEEKVGTLKKRG